VHYQTSAFRRRPTPGDPVCERRSRESIFAGWERGDFSSAEWAHPEIEYVEADGPDAGSWKGLTAMADKVRKGLGEWERWRMEADEYRELDDERVLVLGRLVGRGKKSGLEIGQTGAKGTHIFHVRGGKVIRLVFYTDRQHALADLGLASEADPSAL
jgi:ketosteroid isomerase-like protein